MKLHIEQRAGGFAVTRYDSAAGQLHGVTVHLSTRHQPTACAALSELCENIATISAQREAQLHRVVNRALARRKASPARRQASPSEAA